MNLLTNYQSNMIRFGVSTVKKHSAGPGMKLLTICQAHRIRAGVRAIGKHPAGHVTKSLTSCHAKRTRVGVRTIRRPQLDMAQNHPPAVKPTVPDSKEE